MAETSTDGALPVWPEVRTGFPGGAACDASAQCLSGACTVGSCSDWGHAMRIAVDTTAAGADLREAVTDFPLLVRLDATNFPMAEARADGADIRFVDATGKRLSHEVETWDGEHGMADIWVMLPRVEQNRPDNFVLMYWGNPMAVATTDGASVFGSFTNVLHMITDADGVASHLGDSSGHNNYGISPPPLPDAARQRGIAGPGLVLDGRSAYVTTATRTMSPQPFTLSVWLLTSSLARGGVVGFASSASDNDVTFDRAIWLDELGRISFGISRGGSRSNVSTLTGYNDGAWHLVVARFSGAGQYLFVDGEPAADDPSSGGAGSYMGYWRFGEEPRDTGPETSADAAQPAGNFFAGILDEIRITADQASDAAIKLTYATQRPGATAVSYRRLP